MIWKISRLILLLTAFFFVSASSLSAQDEPRFRFETGSPPWRGERIPLPPGFARDLGWTGVEEIRFAPGMFAPTEPDFFSYILVFALEPDSDISEKGLKRELLTYYRGLSKSVMANAGLEVEADEFTLALQKVDPAKSSAPAAASKSNAWVGTLDWVEPFATKKKQTLYLELHTWMHGESPVVLSCVSPIDRKDTGETWKNLRAIRKSFRLE
jgi:hypothetical protein